MLKNFVHAVVAHVLFQPLTTVLISAAGGIWAWFTYSSREAVLLCIVGALLSVTACFVIKATYTIEQYLQSPKFKIVLEIATPEIYKQNREYKLVPRLTVRSLAAFPIQIDCSESKWSIYSEVNKEVSIPSSTGVVQPNTVQYLTGPDFAVFAPQGDLVGFAQVSVKIAMKYGRTGNPRYSHIADYRLEYTYNAALETNGFIYLEDFERFA